MWTVIYMAQKKNIAVKVKNLLETNGVMARIRSDSDCDEGCFVVLVPDMEVCEAHNLIFDANL